MVIQSLCDPTLSFSIEVPTVQDYATILRSLPDATIAEGIVLSKQLTKASGDAIIPITMLLQITNELGVITAAHVAAAYIVSKMKSNQKVNHLIIGNKKVKLNEKTVAEAFLEEIEKLESG